MKSFKSFINLSTVCLLIVLSIILLGTIVSADNNMLGDAVNITGIKLYKNDVLVNDGDTIYFDDVLKLEYEFNITAGQVQAIQQMLAGGGGATYFVDVPLLDGFKWDGEPNLSEAINVTVNDDVNDTDYQFATLVFDPVNSEVYITFEGSFWDAGTGTAAADTVDSAAVYVTCKLDEDALEDEEELTISLGALTGVTINIGENDKTDHTLAKKCTGYENGVLTWQVTYTRGKKPATFPLTLTDTIDSTFQSFVPGSLYLGKVQLLDTDYTVDDNTITWTIADADAASGESLVFTYQTKLLGAVFSADNIGKDTTLTNEVVLTDGDSLNLDASAEYTLEAEDKTWLQKKVFNNSGTATDKAVTLTGEEIKWEVTITTWDNGLTGLTFYDQIPDGLTLKADSVELDGILVADSAITISTDATGTQFSFIIPQNSQGAYNSTYTITYTTTVDRDNFVQPGGYKNLSLSNKAWLTFTYEGSGESVKIPEVVLKNVGLDTHILRKSGSYNRSTHTITWTVTVNPYKLNITGGTITDIIPDGQTYVDGSFAPITAGYTSGTLNASFDDGELTVVVGSLGENTARFTFQTTVDDPAYYAFNTPDGKTYYNTVSFAGYLDNDETTLIIDERTGSVSVKSEVLAKKSLGYNYNDNTIEWQITVNQNNMAMTDAVVVDTIPQYQTYDPSSLVVKLGGQSHTPLSVSCVPGEDGTSILTINLGYISKEAVITFETKVDVDKDLRFRDQDTIIVENSVVLERTGYDDTPSVAAQETITNKILEKSGVYNSETRKIYYSVNIDPNGMDLSSIEMQDTIPEGLKLDIDSVILYLAEIDSEGKFLNTTVEAASDSWSWRYDSADNCFYVKLLKPDRYILTYECFVVSSKTSYSNSVSFTGSYLTATSKTDTNNVFNVGGWGLTSSQAGTLSIIKQDNQPLKNRLAGVTFQLWTKINGKDTFVDEGTTDENGELSFYLLKLNREYWLKETGGTNGYDITGTTVQDGTTRTNISSYVIRLTESGTRVITITNPLNTYESGNVESGDDGSKVTDPPITELPESKLPPISAGSSLVPTDDGGYLEIGEDGMPIGTWHYDEETEAWIFDPYTPLEAIPQTGVTDLIPVISFLSLLGMTFIVTGFILKKRSFRKKIDG